MGKLMGVIIGLLTIVITLAIAPSIATANAAVSANLSTLLYSHGSSMIGMAVVVTFGAPLAILGLLAMGGLFTVGSWKGSASMRDMLGVIFIAVTVIVGLSFMLNILDYSDALIEAGSGGFETVLYGLIPLMCYLAVIGLAGFGVAKGVGKVRGKKTSSASAAGY